MAAELERRISKLEDGHTELSSSLTQLNMTIALLNQTVESMAKNEEKRQQIIDRSMLFLIGGIASSIVAWIVRGGLAP
jgi:exonuclease VII small subunit